MRFIGVTGHGLSVPKMHPRSLERFDFDSVLCPYNFVQMRDARYARDVRRARRAVRRARRRAADDQEPRPRAVGGPRAHRGDVVRAADRPGRHRPGRPLGARQPAGLPAHHRRRRRAAEAARRRRALRGRARPTRRWRALDAGAAVHVGTKRGRARASSPRARSRSSGGRGRSPAPRRTAGRRAGPTPRASRRPRRRRASRAAGRGRRSCARSPRRARRRRAASRTSGRS